MKHLVAFTLPVSLLAAVAAGSTVGLAVPAVILFVVVPLADLVLGADHDPPRPDGPARGWLALAAGYVVLHLVALGAALARIPNDTPWWGLALAALSLGAGGGVAISANHELVHKRARWCKAVGRAGLVGVGYLHFEIWHLYGHHRLSCTSEDQSTAWFGETLYRYVARTVWGSFREAWRIERGFLRQRGQRVWGPRNLVLWSPLTLVGVQIGCLVLFGRRGLLFAGSAAISVFLLEATSYVEHYGLLRRTDDEGRLERMGPEHSWDTYAAASCAISFMLPRHAHHHELATRPYPALQTVPSARRLPYGYSTMISYALVPPLWRRLMHPLLESGGAPVVRPDLHERVVGGHAQ